jgi:hypothetical protein
VSNFATGNIYYPCFTFGLERRKNNFYSLKRYHKFSVEKKKRKACLQENYAVMHRLIFFPQLLSHKIITASSTTPPHYTSTSSLPLNITTPHKQPPPQHHKNVTQTSGDSMASSAVISLIGASLDPKSSL